MRKLKIPAVRSHDTVPALVAPASPELGMREKQLRRPRTTACIRWDRDTSVPRLRCWQREEKTWRGLCSLCVQNEVPRAARRMVGFLEPWLPLPVRWPMGQLERTLTAWKDKGSARESQQLIKTESHWSKRSELEGRRRCGLTWPGGLLRARPCVSPSVLNRKGKLDLREEKPSELLRGGEKGSARLKK